jgi:hypothetical protein
MVGRPVFAKPRRLDPEKHRIAEAEFSDHSQTTSAIPRHDQFLPKVFAKDCCDSQATHGPATWQSKNTGLVRRRRRGVLCRQSGPGRSCSPFTPHSRGHSLSCSRCLRLPRRRCPAAAGKPGMASTCFLFTETVACSVPVFHI